MIELTQRTFDKLIEGLNHRMTKIELDISWLKRIGIYMSSMLTAIFAVGIIGII